MKLREPERDPNWLNMFFFLPWLGRKRQDKIINKNAQRNKLISNKDTSRTKEKVNKYVRP